MHNNNENEEKKAQRDCVKSNIYKVLFYWPNVNAFRGTKKRIASKFSTDRQISHLRNRIKSRKKKKKTMRKIVIATICTRSNDFAAHFHVHSYATKRNSYFLLKKNRLIFFNKANANRCRCS